MPVRPPSSIPTGRRLALVHQGLLWAGAARRLLHSGKLAEVWLGVVAVHRCVANACQFVDGTPVVAADAAALADCPRPIADLHRLRATLERFRNEILHLPEKLDDDRAVGLSYHGLPQELTITATVRRRGGKARTDSITRSSLEAELDDLEPWLRAHFDRLLDEQATGSP